MGKDDVKVKALVPCRTVGKSHPPGSLFSLSPEHAKQAQEKGKVVIITTEEEGSAEPKKKMTRKTPKNGE